VRAVFGSCTKALQDAGFKPIGSKYRPALHELFVDWAIVVRKVGKIPGGAVYSRHSKFSVNPLKRRFSRWGAVVGALETYIRDNNLSAEYQDVLDIIAEHRKPADEEPASDGAWKAPIWQGRPFYGRPIPEGVLACEPLNEAGVLVLFGAMAKDLGFTVTRVQTQFPDCEALCEVKPGKCQSIRIEFELASHNFLEHGHEPSGCDLIVCWEHDWPECPLPVLELRTELKRLLAKEAAKK
jgi:hypothetical protein